jgi:hypothetical protein
MVVHQDTETGEWFDGTGEDAEPVDPERYDGDGPLMVIEQEVSQA